MRLLALAVGAVALAGCDYMPGFGAGSSTPPPAPERVDAFVLLVESSGCELHQADNDALLDPVGFSDAEASAISQQLIAEGRATVSPEGNLVLLTENCL